MKQTKNRIKRGNVASKMCKTGLRPLKKSESSGNKAATNEIGTICKKTGPISFLHREIEISSKASIPSKRKQGRESSGERLMRKKAAEMAEIMTIQFEKIMSIFEDGSF